MTAEWGLQRARQGAIRSASAETVPAQSEYDALGRAGRDRSARRSPHSAVVRRGRGDRSSRSPAVVLALASLAFFGAASAPDDVFFRAMRDELSRSMARLRLDTLPAPYFIAYRLFETTSLDAAASFGSLVRSTEGKSRNVQVELRVGDYQFDNSNFAGGGGGGGFAPIPLEDDYQEIRRQLWLATDNAYKGALEQIAQKRAMLRNVTRTEDLADFSKEARDSIIDEMAGPPVDRRAAESLVQELSALFRQMPDVFNSSVQWNSGDSRVRYVNSEGTSFMRRSPWISLRVIGSTQTLDGSALVDAAAFYGSQQAHLPSREALRTAVRDLGDRMSRLRAATLLDQYNGPVLFENQAAAEAFNLVFAPRLVASRRPVSRVPSAGPNDNPFMELMGGRVLPAFLSATDDPTRVEFAGQFLGGYRVDDDGVRARSTLLVDHGMLKTLLNARVPVRGIAQSTGNRYGGGAVVSNLFVTADGGIPAAELRKKLLEMAKQRGSEYGVVVKRLLNPGVAAGALDINTLMSLFAGVSSGTGPALNAIEAYRVYPDGREELIRNAQITGMAPATFKEIVAASDSLFIYTAPFSARGMPSPAGGGYAASYVVPSVLFEDIAVRGPRGEIPKPPVAKHPYFDKP